MPTIAKKRLSRKKFKKHLFSSFQKTKPTETGGSVFAERTGKAKKTKFKLDLIEIVGCFSDGHGKYDSNLVSFKKNLYKLTFFKVRRGLCKSIGSPNDMAITPIKPVAIKNAITKKIVPNVRQTHTIHS